MVKTLIALRHGCDKEFIVEFVHETKCFHPHGTDDRDCDHWNISDSGYGYVWWSS